MTEKTPEPRKFEAFYSSDNSYDEEEEAEDTSCDYAFGDECVEPSLRDMGNCFECWLFQEVDASVREQAKESKVEVE